MSSRQIKRWSNWSGSVKATPQEVVKPHTVDELARSVESYSREGRHLRVVGSGHSFTPLVYSDDVLISLDDLQGIEAVDTDQGTVTVWGGTKLHTLSEALLERGLAQENLGDIDVQSISGAISTGTHGTGMRYGTLSTQIEGLTLVTSTGELLECSPQQHPELFKAAQVSLGTLGIIAKVKLRVVPARRMHFKGYRERLSNCLTNLERYKQENSHFEFLWLPYTDWVQAKFLNETDAPGNTGGIWGNFNKIFLENGLYLLLSECCRLVPRLCKTISTISAQAIASVDETDYSHRLFATPRWVRFNEMEYNIPAEHAGAVLNELNACIQKQQFAVHFPIECRFVHSDDIWLSPAYQRESCYIAVHMYRGMPYNPYFQYAEEIFRRYQGRPHWGKLHTQNATSLAALYPRWHDFRRIRASLDPQGVFLNRYLRELFDADGPVIAETQAQPTPIDSMPGVSDDAH